MNLKQAISIFADGRKRLEEALLSSSRGFDFELEEEYIGKLELIDEEDEFKSKLVDQLKGENCRYIEDARGCKYYIHWTLSPKN